MPIHADIWVVDIPKRVRVRHRRGKTGVARGGAAGQRVRVSWRWIAHNMGRHGWSTCSLRRCVYWRNA